jgi:hypothetical protein
MRSAILAILLASGTPGLAEPHRGHPAHDMPMHERFYATWMRPDYPHSSCCNNADCYSPRGVKFENGAWWAIRREDDKWLRIPSEKIEQRRDSPDGRSHLCAPPPGFYRSDTVFCFVPGAGG